MIYEVLLVIGSIVLMLSLAANFAGEDYRRRYVHASASLALAERKIAEQKENLDSLETSFREIGEQLLQAAFDRSEIESKFNLKMSQINYHVSLIKKLVDK